MQLRMRFGRGIDRVAEEQRDNRSDRDRRVLVRDAQLQDLLARGNVGTQGSGLVKPAAAAAAKRQNSDLVEQHLNTAAKK